MGLERKDWVFLGWIIFLWDHQEKKREIIRSSERKFFYNVYHSNISVIPYIIFHLTLSPSLLRLSFESLHSRQSSCHMVFDYCLYCMLFWDKSCHLWRSSLFSVYEPFLFIVTRLSPFLNTHSLYAVSFSFRMHNTKCNFISVWFFLWMPLSKEEKFQEVDVMTTLHFFIITVPVIY